MNLVTVEVNSLYDKDDVYETNLIKKAKKFNVDIKFSKNSYARTIIATGIRQNVLAFLKKNGYESYELKYLK